MFGLFQPRTRVWRCYVRLDDKGRCLSAWKLQQPPQGDGWMEVDDIAPVRIGQVMRQPDTTPDRAGKR